MSRPTSSKPCQHLRLLQSEGLNIDYCSDCAVVHLELEFISLKLRREAFAGLVAAVAHAESNLQAVEHGADFVQWLKRSGPSGSQTGFN